jgi:hypothetical protein
LTAAGLLLFLPAFRMTVLALRVFLAFLRLGIYDITGLNCASVVVDYVTGPNTLDRDNLTGL